MQKCFRDRAISSKESYNYTRRIIETDIQLGKLSINTNSLVNFVYTPSPSSCNLSLARVEKSSHMYFHMKHTYELVCVNKLEKLSINTYILVSTVYTPPLSSCNLSLAREAKPSHMYFHMKHTHELGCGKVYQRSNFARKLFYIIMVPLFLSTTNTMKTYMTIRWRAFLALSSEFTLFLTHNNYTLAQDIFSPSFQPHLSLCFSVHCIRAKYLFSHLANTTRSITATQTVSRKICYGNIFHNFLIESIVLNPTASSSASKVNSSNKRHTDSIGEFFRKVTKEYTWYITSLPKKCLFYVHVGIQVRINRGVCHNQPPRTASSRERKSIVAHELFSWHSIRRSQQASKTMSNSELASNSSDPEINSETLEDYQDSESSDAELNSSLKNCSFRAKHNKRPRESANNSSTSIDIPPKRRRPIEMFPNFAAIAATESFVVDITPEEAETLLTEAQSSLCLGVFREIEIRKFWLRKREVQNHL